VGKIAKKQSERVRFLLILSIIHSYRLLFGDFAHWVTAFFCRYLVIL